MIGYLTGKIHILKPTSLILDVNGVGYNIKISLSTFEKIAENKDAQLFIYTSVKEDSITLFGFYTESEKEMFELLIAVNGIGPKLALNILSGIKTEDLRNAIFSGNVSRIIAVPGIGRKTAERLVLELKSKVEAVPEEDGRELRFSARSEAVAALTTLGYNIKVAEKAVRDVLSINSDLAIEDIIKKALMELGR